MLEESSFGFRPGKEEVRALHCEDLVSCIGRNFFVPLSRPNSDTSSCQTFGHGKQICVNFTSDVMRSHKLMTTWN